jgi:hypothetical protein
MTCPLRAPDTAQAVNGAERRTTEAATAEIEAEIPSPLRRTATGIGQALQRNNMHDRIAGQLTTVGR